MEKSLNAPELKSIEELAAFIIDFWVNITDNGYEGKLPWFQEKGEISDLANKIMFVEARKNEGRKYFTEEEIKLAKTQCVYFLKEKLQNDCSFEINNHSIGMGCFFSKTFGKSLYKRNEKSGSLLFHSTTKFFSIELTMKYYPPKERYVKTRSFIEFTKDKVKALEDYPPRPIISIKEGYQYWQPETTIAFVDFVV